MKVNFEWEDYESAGVEILTCDCGTTLLKDDLASNGTTVECPKCHRTYQFQWVGMTVVEVKDKNERGFAIGEVV